MNTAVVELYRVFEPYRLGSDFSGCNDCVSPSDSERLSSKPLIDLDVSDLNRYAFKAMTTWGTVHHFKHFLPRLMELTLDRYLAFDFPEVVLGKLAYAQWPSWPDVEKKAIQTFLHEFWKHHLSLIGNFPTDDRIQTVLGGLAEACESLKPFLDFWASTKTVYSALHLSQLIDNVADEIMTTGRLQLWGEPTPKCDEIVAWLQTDGVQTLLLHFREAASAAFPHTLSQVDGIRAAMASRNADSLQDD